MNTNTILTGASPNKRQRKDTTTAKKKNAFDIMLDSSKLCWPSGVAPSSHMPILQMVAENGWFPWNIDESSCQNPDYSNLRLVSKDMKTHMDNPVNGGPDFDYIVEFLDSKNGWDNDGFCHHCQSNIDSDEGSDCETCDPHGDYESCPCENSHRYGPALLQLDPRLNPDVKFQTLSLRKRAQLLLQFIRQVASNFHEEYYEKWDKMKEDDSTAMEEDYEDWGVEPDLTMIDPNMYGSDIFYDQLKEYNVLFYNFIHHLLFAGWVEIDCKRYPGSGTPFRDRLLRDGELYEWHGGHREWFGEIWEVFMCLHKSDEEKTVPPQSLLERSWQKPRYTLSQIQYLPETIRRIVENCGDEEAEDLFGKTIAGSFYIYRLVRETYASFGGDYLKAIQWMPCLGVSEENFVPMETFEGYNPHHARLDFHRDDGKIVYKSVSNIDRTGLT